jgi:hypothetical protein
MISVSDNQLRIVAEAADRLPAEARGMFLQRVVAEVREGRSFKDSDIERAVRLALFDEPINQASVSSTDQGGGKLRSDTPTDSEKPLPSHPLAAFLRRLTGLVHLRGFRRSFDFFISVNSRSGRVCGLLRRQFELGERYAREREEHIALQREMSRALNTCRNQLRFKTRVSYCAIWNMHRCCTSPSATNCPNSSEIEGSQMQFQKQPLQRHGESQWFVCSAAVTIVGNTALAWPMSSF